VSQYILVKVAQFSCGLRGVQVADWVLGSVFSLQ
jgi:hypothetical protein